jgi:hypothetical protein
MLRLPIASNPPPRSPKHLPLREKHLQLTFLLLAFIAGILGYSHASRDWGTTFLPAARRLQSGEDLFVAGYTYPPWQAFLAVPFTWIPDWAARILWACVNALAAGRFLSSSWELAGGSWDPSAELTPGNRSLQVFIAGLAAALGYFFDALTNGHTDLIIAALVIGGCLPAMSHRPLARPIQLGLGAAAKLTPLLFVPWFLLRRGLKPAVVILLVVLGVNLLPDLIFPPHSGRTRLADWAERFLTPVAQHPGQWATAPDFNHSLPGFFHRFPATLPFHAAFIALLALLALTALATLLAPRPGKKPGSPENESLQPFEIGMILCLMLLLSPASSKPHFCILLLPAWALARAALVTHQPFLRTLLLLSVLLGIMANKDLTGGWIYGLFKWYGGITLQTILLFFGCAIAHRNVRHTFPPPQLA